MTTFLRRISHVLESQFCFPSLASGCAYLRATRVVGKLVSFFIKRSGLLSEILGRRISELRWVARKQAHLSVPASSRLPLPPVCRPPFAVSFRRGGGPCATGCRFSGAFGGQD